jgi:hypothetical protein
MSASHIDFLLELWAASSMSYGGQPPFSSHNDLYKTIDATPLGDVPWESFSIHYTGERPSGEVPPWMDREYEVWFRDPRAVIHSMLANPDFKGKIDYAPLREFDVDGNRRYQNFFSGDWVWGQAVRRTSYLWSYF